MKTCNNQLLTIAYVSRDNAKDMHSWSGTVYFMAEALKRQGINLFYIDNLIKKQNIFPRLINFVYSRFINIFTNKQFQNNRTIGISKMFAKEIEKRLPENYDVIFIPSGTLQMAFLKSEKKKVIYNDATFASMINFYPAFTNLCSRTLKEGEYIERRAFDNSDLLFFSSDWAAQSAIKDYNVNPSKVKVIPFGANIIKNYTDTEIAEIINNRCKNINSKCNLLFIGVDWERKGGNIALEIVKKLHCKNVNVHLDIVGIKNMLFELPDYVTNHGFLNKNLEVDYKKIEALYFNANFFLLPTRNECYGIVLSEAASFGLPSITTKTGGTETIIKDNINGMTFSLEDPPEKYEEYICEIIKNHEKYKNLCFSTHNDYKERLNWDVAGKQIVNCIKQIF